MQNIVNKNLNADLEIVNKNIHTDEKHHKNIYINAKQHRKHKD